MLFPLASCSNAVHGTSVGGTRRFLEEDRREVFVGQDDVTVMRRGWTQKTGIYSPNLTVLHSNKAM